MDTVCTRLWFTQESTVVVAYYKEMSPKPEARCLISKRDWAFRVLICDALSSATSDCSKQAS
jgi:hypothetical protein